MITGADITTGDSRLTIGKLKDVDVEVLDSLMTTLTAGFKEIYKYDFVATLSALDDTGNSKQKAAQVAACLNKMEGLGFDVSELVVKGGKGVAYRGADEFRKYLLFAFSKLYDIPKELSGFDLMRDSVQPLSSVIDSTRVIT